MDYFKTKVGNISSELSILLDNIQHLENREDLIEELRSVVWKANWLMSHFQKSEDKDE
jgi:hypothetical protein